MFDQLLDEKEIKTPAFIIDEDRIEATVQRIGLVQKKTGCKVLYALKPLIIKDVLTQMVSQVNGFSVSSLFEAKMASSVLGNSGTVHFTSPGLRSDEIQELGSFCNYVAFNSVSQLVRMEKQLSSHTKYGLRINPQMSYVQDARYNPCCKNSRLGIPLHQFNDLIEQDVSLIKGISGIHFHSNCDSREFMPLLETVQHLSKKIGGVLKNLEWINLGGGYLFEDSADYTPLYEAVSHLKREYGLEVFMEPGAAFVRESGYLVSDVIDLVEGESLKIAVLDTTVNHMPEIFEYQCSPELWGDAPSGEISYRLEGASCLAGDVFGSYHFGKPLEIGSRIVFKNMGAYTLIKSHMFNGINLPSVYLWSKKNGFRLKKQFDYGDFLSRVGE